MMRTSSATLALALLLTAAGCTSTVVYGGRGGAGNRYQHFAAGYLGCRARDITIEEYAEDTSGSASWVARCDERRVLCGGWVGSSVHCTEVGELPPVSTE